MTSKEIREAYYKSRNSGSGRESYPESFFLAEIAAQLAEINENMYRASHPAEAKLLDAINSGRNIPSEGLNHD